MFLITRDTESDAAPPPHGGDRRYRAAEHARGGHRPAHRPRGESESRPRHPGCRGPLRSRSPSTPHLVPLHRHRRRCSSRTRPAAPRDAPAHRARPRSSRAGSASPSIPTAPSIRTCEGARPHRRGPRGRGRHRVRRQSPAAGAHPAEGARARREGPRVSRRRRLHEAAVAAFKEAYVLAPSPGLLFNIAQAYRLAGNCDDAAWMYRRFLDTNPPASIARARRAAPRERSRSAARRPAA